MTHHRLAEAFFRALNESEDELQKAIEILILVWKTKQDWDIQEKIEDFFRSIGGVTVDGEEMFGPERMTEEELLRGLEDLVK